ncbi:MAG TPA: hypothetical protein VLM76_09820 [Patescibacteria group bacterium]|nr:hypothetical protein [Patescibacteria group bacterium]
MFPDSVGQWLAIFAAARDLASVARRPLGGATWRASTCPAST